MKQGECDTASSGVNYMQFLNTLDMTTVNTYLTFNENCQEAFHFYKSFFFFFLRIHSHCKIFSNVIRRLMSCFGSRQRQRDTCFFSYKQGNNLES